MTSPKMNEMVTAGSWTHEEVRQLSVLRDIFSLAQVHKRLAAPNTQIDGMPPGEGEISRDNLMVVRNAVLSRGPDGFWVWKQTVYRQKGRSQVPMDLVCRPLYPWFEPKVNDAAPHFSVGMTIVLAFPYSQAEALDNETTVFLPLYPDQFESSGLGSCPHRPDSLTVPFQKGDDGYWVGKYRWMEGVIWGNPVPPSGKKLTGGVVEAECVVLTSPSWYGLTVGPKPVLDSSLDEKLQREQVCGIDEFEASNGQRDKLWELFDFPEGPETDRGLVRDLMDELDSGKLDERWAGGLPLDKGLRALKKLGVDVDLRHNRKAVLAERTRLLKVAYTMLSLTYHHQTQVPIKTDHGYLGLSALQLLNPDFERRSVTRSQIRDALDALLEKSPKKIGDDDPVVALLKRRNYQGSLVATGKEGKDFRKLRGVLLKDAAKLAYAQVRTAEDGEFLMKDPYTVLSIYKVLGIKPDTELEDDEVIALRERLLNQDFDSKHPVMKEFALMGKQPNGRRAIKRIVRSAINLAIIALIGEERYSVIFPQADSK